ncbi:MAG: 3-oxoacid CoA-transferase subunit A [bacterium]
MIDKVYPTSAAAVADIPDGAVIMFGGFGDAGVAENLTRALAEQGAKHLVAISNAAGQRERGISMLFRNNQIRTLLASFPVPGISDAFEERLKAGDTELELITQGTLVERMRAAAAGLGGFYTPTGVGTPVAEGKEVRTLNGREYVLEYPLPADYAILKAEKGDRMGNVVYRMTARNFNPVMAAAARVTIVEVEELVEVGELDPETVATPGIFVQRIVKGEQDEPRWVE